MKNSNFNEIIRGKKMGVVYENRYVAFLDILGFKNVVYQSANEQKKLDVINMALNYTSSVQRENYEGQMPMAELGKQVSVFSDSIVISYEMTRPGSGFLVLMDLIYVCNDLLGVGLPVRGGVTVGALIHENNKCFGPAMVEAYNMESKVAIYPRILIEPKVIEYDLQYRGENNTVEFEKAYITSLIEKDERDNCIYLDYLSQYNEFNDIDTYYSYLCGVRNFIINSLLIYKDDAKILPKYEWMRDYFNKTVAKFVAPFNQLFIQ